MKIDYYRQIHKAIRRFMFNLSDRLGTIDYADSNATQTLQQKMAEFFQFLRSHAEHEDQYFQPFILQKLPSEATLTSKQHHEHDMQMQQIEHLIATFNPNQDSKDQGYELYQQFNIFIGQYLLHLAEEERIMQLLWTCATQDELMQPLQLFLKNLSVEKIKNSVCYFLPALNPEERKAYIQNLRLILNQEDFDQVISHQ